MTQKEIKEGNILIALFDGWKHSGKSGNLVNFYYKENQQSHSDDLEYHSSWDWLKPVLEKIGNIEYSSVSGMREYMNVNFSESKIHIYQKIDIVFPAVVGFVKWYNEAVNQEVKKRENGFYWISKTGYAWSVAEYKDGYWFLLGNDCHYSDYGLKEKGYSVNENRIKNE